MKIAKYTELEHERVTVEGTLSIQGTDVFEVFENGNVGEPILSFDTEHGIWVDDNGKSWSGWDIEVNDDLE